MLVQLGQPSDLVDLVLRLGLILGVGRPDQSLRGGLLFEDRPARMTVGGVVLVEAEALGLVRPSRHPTDELARAWAGSHRSSHLFILCLSFRRLIIFRGGGLVDSVLNKMGPDPEAASLVTRVDLPARARDVLLAARQTASRTRSRSSLGLGRLHLHECRVLAVRRVRLASLEHHEARPYSSAVVGCCRVGRTQSPSVQFRRRRLGRCAGLEGGLRGVHGCWFADRVCLVDVHALGVDLVLVVRFG